MATLPCPPIHHSLLVFIHAPFFAPMIIIITRLLTATKYQTNRLPNPTRRLTSNFPCIISCYISYTFTRRLALSPAISDTLKKPAAAFYTKQ